MNVLIRCEAGGVYGLGHVVRCLALAKTLTALGIDVAFITETHEAVSAFVAPYPCGTTDTITHGNVACLITDTKFPLDETWYRWYASAVRCDTVVRIDHPHASPGTCDLLVGPCAHWDPAMVDRLRIQYGDRFLYGWDYVMLPPEVTRGRMRPLGKGRAIAFCAGGSDPGNDVQRMENWTREWTSGAPLWFLHPGDAVGYRIGLREAGLVVGMMGVSVYEALWYRKRMLVFTRTDDERQGIRHLRQIVPEHIYDGGNLWTWTHTEFCDLVAMIYAKTREADVSETCLLDGRGVQRVANALLALA